MSRTEWLLRLSIKRYQDVYQAGYWASSVGQHLDACPYPAWDSSVRAERECWLKGWRTSELHDLPAVE